MVMTKTIGEIPKMTSIQLLGKLKTTCGIRKFK